MAHVHRLSVFRPKRAVRSRHDCYYESEEVETKNEDFECEKRCLNSINSNLSHNVVDFVHRREHGDHHVRPISFKTDYGTRRILEHSLLKEAEVSLESANKVFCAKWLSDRHVVLGTKCNKLLALDLINGQAVQIPSLMSSDKSVPPCYPCGIHSIQINPSHTLLATGAQNSNDIAVYRLPTLDPLCVGEGAHNDWIFDLAWLDDNFFVSGSRDTKIALWRVEESFLTSSSSNSDLEDVPNYSILSPLVVRTCERAEKIRALCFNHKYQEFAALSLNGCLHIWDLYTFKQILTVALPRCSVENVCLAITSDCSLYAVGSKSHLTLHDSRTLCAIEKVPTKFPECSIRSVSFKNNIVTMGTGNGLIMFYDTRAGKYLELDLEQNIELLPSDDLDTPKSTAVLRASRGWVYPDEIYREVFQYIEYRPAIYTHCYDPSGTKLFAAGGPLTASLYGNYVGLWQ